MSASFQIDGPRGLVRFSCSGDLSLQDLTAIVPLVLDHPEYRPGMSTLWDFRGCSLAGLTSSDLAELRWFNSVKTTDFPHRKTALVADEDLAFGISRTYEAMLSDPRVEVGVFRTLAEAEAWITEGSAPPLT